MRNHGTSLVNGHYVTWSDGPGDDFDAYVDDDRDLDGSRADLAAAREYGSRDA